MFGSIGTRWLGRATSPSVPGSVTRVTGSGRKLATAITSSKSSSFLAPESSQKIIQDGLVPGFSGLLNVRLPLAGL